jgi:uncharacterized membrane protein YkoI
MISSRRLLLAAALSCLAVPAAAEDVCLSQREARQAVGQGRALDFARVKRSVENETGGDVLRARLCRQQDGRLVYTLTLLRPGGQVVAMWVDAASGEHGPLEHGPRPQWLDRREAQRPGN